MLGPRRAPTSALCIVAGLAVGAAALSGCGGSGPSSTSASTTAAPGTTSASTAGCGRSQTAGSTTIIPTVDGHRRTVVVHLPTGYTGMTKAALVLNLHGSGSTASEQETFSAMDATADAHGFVVAYPQGLIPSGSGFDWNVPGVPLVGGASVAAGAADDVAFLTDLVAVVEQRYCIDAARVFATGMSGGGRMASQLACDASTVFAAVAPVAGLRRPMPCPASRPVPVVAFHGTADPIDPYNGNGDAYWTYSVPQAAADWAGQDGCSATPSTTQPASGVTLISYAGCAGGSTVELYTLQGEGHEWPGGPHMPRSLTDVLGPQSSAVDANTVMWTFFEAHPMPR